ncbi:hypothetical protein [Chitinophaga pinensis]|uniref:Uncharacterized protein n=1 Tax=Chitinophaga pinensis (strain ATCC 43595 / DSM 2588 / LMG 13176 / NBRC 15968 / NCIMB 11800 / UQM 2034) TaxID=485918 RepID=A0A979GQE4_CHIPD|nr:hypothetical protein [Chitinophaga pinensis]ACU61372.1 hypothetical protein Cpin_3910 [Chitinophaga pinensis DSM 2588]
MDRPLKIWQFLAGLMGMAVMFGTIIYNAGTMNAKNELRITTLENNFSEFKKDAKEQAVETSQKLDKIDNTLFDIKLMLQQKEDRKK